MEIKTTSQTPYKALRQKSLSYFTNPENRSYEARLQSLQKFEQAYLAHEKAILAALEQDLGRGNFDAYATEVATVLREIRFAQKHLQDWLAPKRVPTPLAGLPGQYYYTREPLGHVLIIGPWNYPFLCLFSPLVGAIAAGNVITLKPSEFCSKSTRVIKDIVAAAFDEAHVSVIEGGPEVASFLTNQPWNHILFTGSNAVGRLVATAAAATLTPVTLELGGKSPCIIDKDIPIDVAARRIIWGKFLNAGQTCLAPDYLLVPRQDKTKIIAALQTSILQFYGQDPMQCKDFGRIINSRNFSRLKGLLADQKILHGGQSNERARYLAPTLVDEPTFNSPLMSGEIFGPILPILSYDSLEEIPAIVERYPEPLALYLFTQKQETIDRIYNRLQFGGGAINDTLMQMNSSHLPFGGVGASGVGRYNGKYSFETFSHARATVRNSMQIDLPLRYPPYTPLKDKVMRLAT